MSSRDSQKKSDAERITQLELELELEKHEESVKTQEMPRLKNENSRLVYELKSLRERTTMEEVLNSRLKQDNSRLVQDNTRLIEDKMKLTQDLKDISSPSPRHSPTVPSLKMQKVTTQLPPDGLSTEISTRQTTETGTRRSTGRSTARKNHAWACDTCGRQYPTFELCAEHEAICTNTEPS